MKIAWRLLWILGLFACSKPTSPSIVGGDLSGGKRTIIEGSSGSNGSSSEALQALYKELPLTEKVMPFMPKASCAQTSLLRDPEAETSTLSVTCRLIQGRVEYKVSEGNTVGWSYTNDVQPFTPSQIASETSPSAKFDFINPDPVMNIFLADSGKFTASIKFEGRSIPIDVPKVQVVGETCTKPLEGVINIMQNGGYTIVTSRVSYGGDGANRRFIAAGATAHLTTDSQNATIIGINGAKTEHNGNNARVILTDTSSFTTDRTPAAVFAGPSAVVSAPSNVFRFKNELGLCERQ